MSSVAWEPKRIPKGFNSQRFAPVISQPSFPSIVDGLPPVTRPMTLVVPAGPVKVAL